MTEIVMPRLSDTMEEGTILRWLKADGQTVGRGEELVEIETDKATMVYESDVEGTLTLLAAEGDTLAVGEPIARVGDSSAADASGQSAGQPGTTDVAVQAQPSGTTAPERQANPATADRAEQEQASGTTAPERQANPATADRAEQGRTTPAAGAAASEAVAGAPGVAAAAGRGSKAAAPIAAQPGAGLAQRVKASPLARRIARERGIELGDVTGSGPGGRIVKADLAGEVPAEGAKAPSGTEAGAHLAAAPGHSAGATAGTAAEAGAVIGPETVATAKGTTTEVELNRLQQAVARRMAESKATIPDFTLQIDVDMDDCVKLRGELKRLAVEGSEVAPTYNDMVVKACALALREHPKANGSYRDGKLQLYSRINVGVAVAADDALVVPTVFDADTKALGEIARETRALAERVRAQTITPPELGGGTFTVSNLGMFGVRSFTAIINPPQAAIMSVGALERRAVVDDEGGIAARQMLTLTLVSDHRILFGADSAQFLARVRELLESPVALTL